MKLQDEICIVTGAGRGIGEAIARLFAQEGGRVVIADCDVESGQRLAEELRADFFALAVAAEDDWKRLEEAFPRIGVLVNNAGITGLETGKVHNPEEATLQDWQHVHAVNLDGAFLGCRYAIKAMRRHGRGSIVNISSRSGMIGIPAAAAYASSKAALRNHTKTVALYCAEQGLSVRCNSIHPGAILTPIWEPMLGSGAAREEAMSEFVKDTPLRRFGTPEEVAKVALFLASEDSSYMTGAELTVDGGLLAGACSPPK